MVATWIGMTVGAILGFGLARRFGQPFAVWFSSEEDLEGMQQISERFGPAILVLTRAVPVFAEASVLVAGIHQLSWRRFLLAVSLSNFGIAIAYAGFGDLAEQNQWFPLAMAIAIAMPVAFAMMARRWLPGSDAR